MRYNIFIIALVVSGIIFLGFDLRRTQIIKGINVSLPGDFKPMTDVQIQQRYLSSQEPIGMYISPDQRADFGVNLARSQWRADDLGLIKDFYKSSLYSLYDSIRFMNENIEKINNQPFIRLEMVTMVKPDKNDFTSRSSIVKYSHIGYTVINGKTLIFNFTCDYRAMERYKDVAHAVINSIKISKTL